MLRLNVSDWFCLLLFPVDINECLDESLCEGGQCQNMDGSYICMCKHPMVLDPNSNNCVFVPDVAGETPPVQNYVKSSSHDVVPHDVRFNIHRHFNQNGFFFHLQNLFQNLNQNELDLPAEGLVTETLQPLQ